MKISGHDEEENRKTSKKNSFKEINLSIPNSKAELMDDKTLKLETDDKLKKISNLEIDSPKVDVPKIVNINLNINSNKNELEVSEYENSNSKKDNTNFIESKKTRSQEKSKNNYDYDFLSLSEIDFDTDKDFQFLSFISKKKNELNLHLEIAYFYNYDSKSEEIYYFQGNNKIRARIFLESNKITVFNYSTNFKLKTGNYFPMINLDFDFLTAELFVEPDNNIFRIMALGVEKIFKFFISDNSSFLNIANKLHLIIQNSKGYNNNILSIILRKDFFKFYYMNLDQFVKKAKTGDLLLFRGFEFPAKCQRCCTGAHYDHVALLIKKYTELEVYEATSLQGCKVRPWRYFISNGWIYSYDKIIYRELIYNKESERDIRDLKDNIADNLDKFLLQTKDKNYSLPVSIICCPGKKDFEEKNIWTKSKGFFCSQLVAAAYLSMGIIKYDKCSLRYFPGNFSHTANLPLNDNFSLGPEIIVDFSR